MDLDWNLEAENPADVQNQLSDLLNVPYMLIDTPGEYNGNTFTFTPEESGEYYVYVTNRSVENRDGHLGRPDEDVFPCEPGVFHRAGPADFRPDRDPQGERERRADRQAYRFSYEGLEAVYETLSAEPLTLNSWTSSSLDGTVTASQQGLLMTTIPYDTGWTVRVDGTEVTPGERFWARSWEWS